MGFQRGTFRPSAGAARHHAKPFEVRSSLMSLVRAHSQVELSRAGSQLLQGWNQQPQTGLHERRSHGKKESTVCYRTRDRW